MQSGRLLFELLADVSSADPRRSTTDALRAFEQRLAEAQRELSLQFTRIQELQADLDLSVQALRRVRDGSSPSEASRRPSARVGESRNGRRDDC